ncbi:PocR ligand-binding domain-containing protein [Methanobacterium alkalithermotolerans]|uniref:PocR ligand-binding domain-containing protein n=1 Tax=Methanobacterium alkalithermotolerans TaxID=2731220 RepID=A0A8T8K3X6_9EURY|nr:PocR ligand-binding domain-containing protein [Methanobacterium alkalithermotolerans]QUH22592.1 PocR ligand-binding domain-containing protein [Methanobacterium alkalithermotolerans]
MPLTKPLDDYLDMDIIQDLMQSFYEITAISSTLIDRKGKIFTTSNREIVGAGWQDICLKFHRKNPRTYKRCLESDTVLAGKMEKERCYSSYKCLNGLVDMALPVYIQNEHVANLFTGQFFLEKPDREFFKKQAQEFGFPQEEYLAALDKVPVFTEEYVEKGVMFLKKLAMIIGEMAIKSIKLQESEHKFRSILNNLPGAVFELTAKKDGYRYLSYIGPRIHEMFGFDQDKDIQMEIVRQLHPEDRESFLISIEESLSNARPFNHEARFITPSGEKWFQVISTPVHCDEDLLYHGVILDIHDRKLAEQIMEKSLQEKKLLLQEIHHRVKNNMQIISSLMNLQAMEMDDEKTLKFIRDSQNRVKSMAIIHEKLYESTDLSRISFKDYLHNLISYLYDSYTIHPGRVKLKTMVNDFSFNIDTAIPLGLIINELASNSLKYAFPEEREGELCINLKKVGEKFKLVVADNGIGFPEHFDYKNTTTLGLQLVNKLTQQLDGSITLDNKKGSKFIIEFSELEYRERLTPSN